MSKTLTLTLPEGYDVDLLNVVLVAAEETNFAGDPVGYSVTVLDAQGVEVEEVGCGPLTSLMTDAARVVRTGTAVIKR